MTLTIQIPDKEFKRFGLQSVNLAWDEVLQKIKTELAKQALENSQKAALDAGLAEMTMDEINAEIQAVRNAKNNH